MSVIEIAQFALVPGVTEAQFQTALAASQRWLERQPGFVARRVGAGPGGRVDLVEWDSMAAAKAAADQFGAAPETSGFMALITPDSVDVRHFELLP